MIELHNYSRYEAFGLHHSGMRHPAMLSSGISPSSMWREGLLFHDQVNATKSPQFTGTQAGLTLPNSSIRPLPSFVILKYLDQSSPVLPGISCPLFYWHRYPVSVKTKGFVC